MVRRVQRCALVAVALSACAPSMGTPAPEDAANTDVARAMDVGLGGDSSTVADAAMEDAAAGGYPAGPYGNAVGATMANLALEGFVNDSRSELSTRGNFGRYSLAELRAGGARYALVHTSGFL
ncbi:MAG: hypothetical protein JNK05_39650 [Myxococcales bacterium]|nr:hypothetical protein [Myxococcales bacterium]